jgi:hypothetical protein
MGSIDGYELVSAKTASELSDLVSARILEGWKLFGKPFTGEGTLYQALVVKNNPEKRLRRTTEDG